MKRKQWMPNKKLVNKAFWAPRSPQRQGGAVWKTRNGGSKFNFFKKNKSLIGNPRFGGRRTPFHRPGARYKLKGFQKRNAPYMTPAARRASKALFYRAFAASTYRIFKKNPGPDKKLAMYNYWRDFKETTEPKFAFTFSQVDNKFYLGVVRSYMKAIRYFIKSFLRELGAKMRSGEVEKETVLAGLYGAYRVRVFIDYLAKVYEQPLKKPDYYFKGYRTAVRMSFFRYITIFCTKIFILANKAYAGKNFKIHNHASFLYVWKKVYKIWLNIHYADPRQPHKVSGLFPNALEMRGLVALHARNRNRGFWRSLFNFRRERIGYKRTLRNYFFKYAQTNYDTIWPFSYRKKKHRYKYNIFGKRVYLQRRPSFRRKSRKYIRWFRSLVTSAYYFSPKHAEKTFFKGGYGKRAWFSRRRARHVFKMKFVFIRYFSKRFGLKNRTDFLRKAEHIARKGGNKWLRYYAEFESRLLRVLVLFGLSSNDEMANNFISNDWVLVNKKMPNDHHHKTVLRVKRGDLVTLANSAAAAFLKKKFKFFRKRLNIFSRSAEAKGVYRLFKKQFSDWMLPSIYYINGNIIRYGLSALMSGPVVTNSRIYYSINRFIPFFNRTLFKIFVRRFSKKLN